MESEEMLYVLSNTKFMNWMVDRLRDHYYIDDHDSKLNGNDYFFAQKMEYLYALISEYAMNNNIEPTKFMQYNLFYVNYEGVVFFVYEGDISYGCFNNTLDKKDIPYCINFSDVRRSKMDEVINEDNNFMVIKEEIDKLYRKGISINFIHEITNELINRINHKEKGYKKVK